MCGTSRWKAAKSTSKTMKNLDETGVVVSCCRHQIAQKAVNMFRGEMYVTVCICYSIFDNIQLSHRYGYTHYLHINDFIQRKTKYLWQDVVCQYWPWAKKAALSTPAALEIKPCLPAMHAKAHTWHCQVRIYVCMYVCGTYKIVLVCECMYVRMYKLMF